MENSSSVMVFPDPPKVRKEYTPNKLLTETELSSSRLRILPETRTARIALCQICGKAIYPAESRHKFAIVNPKNGWIVRQGSLHPICVADSTVRIGTLDLEMA